MIRTDRRLRLCRTLIVLNLVFIWGNSLMPGAVSEAFSDWVKYLLSFLLRQGSGIVSQGSGLVRKLAHFTEFTALGVLLTWLHGMLGKKKGQAFLWGAAAAGTDETIQLFIPQRGPGLRDVCIDCCGVLFGMLLLTLGHYYWKKHFGGTTI